MRRPGQTFEVVQDTTLHTVDGQTIQVRENDLLEFLGGHNFRGHYQSDPIPEDHFRLLGGSQSADEDHPNHGAEGVLSASACDYGVAKPSYLAFHRPWGWDEPPTSEPVSNPNPPREAFVADLEMVIGDLTERFEKLQADCREKEFTPEQEARWESAFLTLRGVLADGLNPMLEAWKEGHQFSRKGEKLAGNED